VIAHDDVFDQDTDDDVWLAEAGRCGWIVLTRDDRIRYRPAEQQAILDAGIVCFCLHPSKGMTGEDMAGVFAAVLPRMLAIALRRRGTGCIIGVSRTGRLRQLYPR